jgi:hypothetical protein
MSRRGWEKSSSVGTGGVGAGGSASGVAAAIMALSAADKATHRGAFLCFLSALAEQQVVIVVKTNKDKQGPTTYEGMFHTATPFACSGRSGPGSGRDGFFVVLKHAKAVAGDLDGPHLQGTSLVVKAENVLSLSVKKEAVVFKADITNELQTDAAIQQQSSGGAQDDDTRALKAVDSG